MKTRFIAFWLLPVCSVIAQQPQQNPSNPPSTTAPAVTAPAQAYINRGFEKLRNRDVAGAIADYTEAIRLDPKSARAYDNRGVAKVHQGDLAGAVADYTEAIHLDPNRTATYCNRGVAKGRQGDSAGAIVDYTEAIRLDSNNYWAYRNRAIIKYRQGDLAGAIIDYTEVIRLQPNDSWAYLNRGTAKGRQGDLAEALTDLNEAIRLNPNDYKAYYNRSVTRDKLGDKSGAVQDRATAARVQEQVTFAEFCLKAKVWRELPVKPPLPEAVQRYRILAEEAYQHQDYQAAVAYYEKGLAVEPMWAQGHFNVASLFGDYLQNYNKAVSHMRRYLELRPDASNAAAGRQQMAIWQEKAKSGVPSGSPTGSPAEPSNVGGLNLK